MPLALVSILICLMTAAGVLVGLLLNHRVTGYWKDQAIRWKELFWSVQEREAEVPDLRAEREARVSKAKELVLENRG